MVVLEGTIHFGNNTHEWGWFSPCHNLSLLVQVSISMKHRIPNNHIPFPFDLSLIVWIGWPSWARKFFMEHQVELTTVSAVLVELLGGAWVDYHHENKQGKVLCFICDFLWKTDSRQKCSMKRKKSEDQHHSTAPCSYLWLQLY